ncbi:hypothetical protein V2J09_014944 [Rumex salicifolius]
MQMENISSVFYEVEEQMVLPAGFRFHPTDEELITYYLSPKVINNNFSARAIGEVDLNKCEPWDLPKRAKMGEKEWYFFCLKDRKYPTGLRTNRATEAGYWKATGKDKEIYKDKSLVGMKKTLVFYMGRAPKGEKSNWVMHEYRLEGRNSPENLPAKNEWVICRVFEKTLSGKKIPFSGMGSDSIELCSSNLPPLMDSSPFNDQTKNPPPNLPHVPCFSNSITHQDQNSIFGGYLSQGFYPRNPNPFYPPQINQFRTDPQYPFGGYLENDVLRSIVDSNGGTGEKQGMMKTEMDMGVTVSLSQDACLSSERNAEISNYDMGRGPFDDYHEGPSTSGGPVDIESICIGKNSARFVGPLFNKELPSFSSSIYTHV